MGLVKLNKIRMEHFFKLEMLSSSVQKKLHPGSYCIEVSGVPVLRAGGDKEGQAVEGSLVANQSVYMPMGILKPTTYHAMVEIHPSLYGMGDTSIVRIAEPSEETPLVLRLKARTSCDPSSLPWIARIYLID